LAAAGTLHHVGRALKELAMSNPYHRLRHIALSGFVLAAALVGGNPAGASCDSRPGTPDQVQAVPTSATSIKLIWRNTTGKPIDPNPFDQSHSSWFDILVRDARNKPLKPSKDIIGGAAVKGIKYGQHSHFEFKGLSPDTEYRFQMKARDGSGRDGCLSEHWSSVVSAKTPTVSRDNLCRTYADRAIQQVNEMRSHPQKGPCNASGGNWSTDRDGHYAWCLSAEATLHKIGREGPSARETRRRNEALAACRTSLAPPRPAAASVPREWADMLNVHNEMRKRHCTPNLEWDSQLAAAAQDWANKCTNTHSDAKGQYGENLAFFTRTGSDGKPILPAASDRDAYLNAWYCEGKNSNYNYDNPTFAGGFTNNCAPPTNGHFTQVLWKGSHGLGCGRATCTINGQRGTYWVCRYAPAGNDSATAALKANVLKPTCN
jgi:uncharacterized protein YkwD